MTRIVIAVLISVLLTFPVMAAEEFFKVLCIEEANTGFSWEKGGWKQSKFKEYKHLIEKVKIEPLSKTGRSGSCDREYDPNQIIETKAIKMVSGCYNIRHFGDEFIQGRSEICDEIWKKKEGVWKLHQVSCNNFHFQLDGYFHAAVLGSNFERTPKDDYKDTMHLMVGTCSKL